MTITSGASGGASGTAGVITIDTGSAAGGTGAAITIGGTNATGINIGNGTVSTAVTGRMIAQLLAMGPKPTDTYGSTIAIDVTKSLHVIAGVNGTSATSTLTPSAAGSAGDVLTILTAADASGTVTVTFASTFHSSGTQATTASHFSSIMFQSDGTRWYELCRTTARS